MPAKAGIPAITGLTMTHMRATRSFGVYWIIRLRGWWHRV